MLNAFFFGLLLFVGFVFNHISVGDFSTLYYLSTIHEKQREYTLEDQNRIKREFNVLSVQFSVAFNEILKQLTKKNQINPSLLWRMVFLLLSPPGVKTTCQPLHQSPAPI